MYLKLLKLLITTSKRALYMFLVQVIAMQLLLAETSNSQILENVKVTIKLKQATLEEVFQRLEAETEFIFGYNKKTVSSGDKLSLDYKKESLNKILENISKDTGLKFRMINNTISVSRKDRHRQKAVKIMADVDVSGKVTDESGVGLPGASVVVKGTANGTTTDLDGNYKISAPEGSVLAISYVGYITVEVDMTGRSIVDVRLEIDAEQLEEVIVTAFGLKREKKALTYAAQNVNTEEISEARALNVVNSLSGKVSGISIIRSGNGVGSPSRVILRGNRSIDGNSQPLYIVDGVPILGDITDLNPDDIAEISVLKGPNAAALYGNRANNGAIIITTKSGSSTEGFKVSLGTTFMTETPILLQNYQNQFGQGNSGVYAASSEQSWGPSLGGNSVAHWSPNPDFGTANYAFSGQPDNVSDFFQTGHNLATNLSINAGNALNQTYFSYTFTDASGIVPSNDLKRHNINLRISNKLSDKVSLDSKVTYIKEDIANQLATGENFANPIRHAYRLPRNIRTQDASEFEYVNPVGLTRQHYWNPGSNGGANPYWTINRNLRSVASDRLIAFASLRYQFNDEFSLKLRSAADRLFEKSNQTYYNDSYIIADNGAFEITSSEALEWNTDILLSYEKALNDNWFVNANFGGNLRKERSSGLTARIERGDGLIVPNIFDFGNTQRVTASQYVGPAVPGGTSPPGIVLGPRDVQSLYGFAQLSYKNSIFLDLTARNDWSSTLPANNRSFFYPSIGLNGVISDLVDLPDVVTFAKLRASYAEVGNDARPFQLVRTASITPGGNGGFVQLSTTIPNADLKPESTRSLELGTDLRFFDNRLGLDLTYYKSNTRDQLIPVFVPIGQLFERSFLNAGDVQNSGIEMILNVSPIVNTDFRWDLTFNFARNRSKVVKINDERPSITVSQDFLREFRIVQGQPWGDVYSRGFARDSQGRVIIESDGTPRITDGLEVPVANFNPDWLGGIRNSFTYKNFNMSFLFDVREGGSVVSLTNAILYADGTTEETLQGRDGTLVFGQNFFANETAVLDDGSPNNISIDAETFWRKVGGRNAPVGEVFAVDASNIRLRELVFGYSLPATALTNLPFTSVKFSVVGRNLFFLSNSAGNLDPEVAVGTGKEVEGFESFAPPTTRSFGFNVKFGF